MSLPNLRFDSDKEVFQDMINLFHQQLNELDEENYEIKAFHVLNEPDEVVDTVYVLAKKGGYVTSLNEITFSLNRMEKSLETIASALERIASKK